MTRYEPDELPGCSTPQKHHNTQLRFLCKCPFAGLSLSLPDEPSVCAMQRLHTV